MTVPFGVRAGTAALTGAALRLQRAVALAGRLTAPALATRGTDPSSCCKACISVTGKACTTAYALR